MSMCDFFFFKQKTAYEMRISDWSSDVCSSDLAHIRNRDTLIMTVTATLAGAIGMLANFALFFGGGNNRNNGLGFIGSLAIMILAPLAAMLVQMAISRSREYAADHAGAEIRSEEHTSELQSLMRISYAVFCLKK